MDAESARILLMKANPYPEFKSWCYINRLNLKDKLTELVSEFMINQKKIKKEKKR